MPNYSMTDHEFDLLDELYFVISYFELLDKLGWEQEVLTTELCKLYDRKWIKILDKLTLLELENMPKNIEQGDCLFLATKQGLLAHNCRY